MAFVKLLRCAKAIDGFTVGKIYKFTDVDGEMVTVINNNGEAVKVHHEDFVTAKPRKWFQHD